MVIKSDGTKWACQPCMKGHRVSACNHTDRELTFVPKKGRPTTQCSHCRGERKKRSAHVKCDCGITCTEKGGPKQKCIHLPDPITGLYPKPPYQSSATASTDKPTGQHSCCCHHGEECTCFTAKKDVDSKVDAPPKAEVKKHTPPARAKPRLTTVQSDGHLSGTAAVLRKPLSRSMTTTHDPYRVHKHHAQPHHIVPRRSEDDLMALAMTDASGTADSDQDQTADPERRWSDQFTLRQDPNLQAYFASEEVATDSSLRFPVQNEAMAASDTFIPDFSQAAMSADLSQHTLDHVAWENYPWNDSPVYMDAPNSTYASSNTISEMGPLTPTEQLMQTSSTQGQSIKPWGLPHEQKFAGFDMPAHNVLQNRFSLPSSFQPGFSSMYALDFNAMSAQIQENTTTGASSSGLTSDVLSSSNVSGLPMDYSSGTMLDGNMTNSFPWMSEVAPSLASGQLADSVDATGFSHYTSASADPFFGVETANDMLEFGPDYFI